MTLGYSYIAWSGAPVPVPERQLNGGLYTGEPFKAGASWANVPVEPEPAAMSANIARTDMESLSGKMGQLMYPTYTRPGNNNVNLPGYDYYDQKNFSTMSCISGTMKG